MTPSRLRALDKKLNAIIANANVTDQRVKEDSKTAVIYKRIDAMIVRRRPLA